MMAKKKEADKSCADCIHEVACIMWTNGRRISNESANRCPNHVTVKDSAAYLCGVLDERKRRRTNADRIRAMSDEDLAKWMYENEADAKIPYCVNSEECGAALDNGIHPTKEMCIRCLCNYLKW